MATPESPYLRASVNPRDGGTPPARYSGAADRSQPTFQMRNCPKFLALAVFVFSLAPGHAAALALPPGLTPVERVVVAAILDADTLRLGDGREVRLAGVMAPKATPTGPGSAPAEAARAALAAAIEGRSVELVYGEKPLDRHRRLVAHVVDSAGSWLQAELVGRGLVRVFAAAEARSGALELLALERQARLERRGLWADPAYRVLRHDDAYRFRDTFQLVEGRVVAIARVRGRHYLNFGPDWRTDFTLALPHEALARFKASGLDPGALVGRMIRVRGWIRAQNGPLIDVTYPEQIEVLDQ